MRKSFLLLALLHSCAVASFAQRSLAETDENKYRVNLPDHWKPHSKAIRVLSDVLPVICPELKDKDICGDDCNPAWTVEFYLSEPELEYYEINGKPTFPVNTNTRNLFVRPGAYITPSTPQPSQIENNPGIRQSAVNPSGKEIVSYFNFQCFLLLLDKQQKIVTRLVLVDTNETWKKVITSAASAPVSNKQDKTVSLLPGAEELLAIADKKILALGKKD